MQHHENCRVFAGLVVLETIFYSKACFSIVIFLSISYNLWSHSTKLLFTRNRLKRVTNYIWYMPLTFKTCFGLLGSSLFTHTGGSGGGGGAVGT